MSKPYRKYQYRKLLDMGLSPGVVYNECGADLVDIVGWLSRERKNLALMPVRKRQVANVKRLAVQSKLCGMTKKGLMRQYGLNEAEAIEVLRTPRKPKKSQLTLAAEQALAEGFDRETVAKIYGESALPE